jgi:hypothetical protein
MSDRKALAREIAARTRPCFIEIKPEPRRKSALATRTIEIPRECRSGVPFTEEELTTIRGGRTGGGIPLVSDPEVGEIKSSP